MPDLEPVDYLLIGHVAVDITPAGNRLGGTASYAALTAKAMGLRVGVVTSAGEDAPLYLLDDIQIVNIPAGRSTTFENVETENGRRQTLYHRATPITFDHIPNPWRNAAIVHLAPIAQEADPALAGMFPSSWVGVTPQGWMRAWDEKGSVESKAWENSEQVLGRVGGVVLSLEDIHRDFPTGNCAELVEWMAHHTNLLCLTEGADGAVLHWHGDRRRFRPPLVEEVDATGAGDIFAAAFFTRHYQTRDPWEAARFAVRLAALSVTRFGLDGIPTRAEIELCKMEVLS
ncbi:MAG: ribokinase [Chloroflexi bacterium CFX1]|nr:ribokinase [Chloroflexi bacterium CFX1]MCK6569311.1 PfkB family carbohydrate kinase [Anaerolineales bacterium]MCQ3953220.1 ribokinase [Chloroflexota bacterium]MDL1920032.1 ribokinase [Chloroflexi bacterium CFX5]NUQ59100.1 ribokinase [Anaerolineales bacterium]